MGVFLSGGIDSSANTVLFSEGHSGAVNTFSVGYDSNYQTYSNELPYARLMAERAEAKHHEILYREGSRRLCTENGGLAGRANRRSSMYAGVLRIKIGSR